MVYGTGRGTPKFMNEEKIIESKMLGKSNVTDGYEIHQRMGFRGYEEITSIELLEEETRKVLLLEDEGIIRMIVACIIANRIDSLDPVWLMVVAASSSGKSELISYITDMGFIHPISDLTVNTFASGLSRKGQETSLLHKIGNGIMAFKDFTSILSKSNEAQEQILGQLREIFDGSYTKETGNGESIKWRGKIGAIAGCTEMIYRAQDKMSAMGDRFIMYSVKQPDRIEAARRAMENSKYMGVYREHMKLCYSNYINLCLDYINNNDIKVDREMQEVFLEVADFATRVRSAVLTDIRTGLVDFVPTPEMPMRVISQLMAIAAAFIAMEMANPFLPENSPARSGKLTKKQLKFLFKTAFDSVPRSRRDALIPMAKYRDGVSTAGLATHLGLPTLSVGKYLAQINALGVCTRVKVGGTNGDVWKLKESYRQVMLELEDIEVVDGQLLADAVGNENDESTSFFSTDYEEVRDFDSFY